MIRFFVYNFFSYFISDILCSFYPNFCRFLMFPYSFRVVRGLAYRYGVVDVDMSPIWV